MFYIGDAVLSGGDGRSLSFDSEIVVRAVLDATLDTTLARATLERLRGSSGRLRWRIKERVEDRGASTP